MSCLRVTYAKHHSIPFVALIIVFILVHLLLWQRFSSFLFLFYLLPFDFTSTFLFLLSLFPRLLFLLPLSLSSLLSLLTSFFVSKEVRRRNFLSFILLFNMLQIVLSNQSSLRLVIFCSLLIIVCLDVILFLLLLLLLFLLLLDLLKLLLAHHISVWVSLLLVLELLDLEFNNRFNSLALGFRVENSLRYIWNSLSED